MAVNGFNGLFERDCDEQTDDKPTFVCRHCGAPMLLIETFARAQHIRGPPDSARPP